MKPLFLLLAGFLMTAPTLRADPVLQPNDLVAICGDSITEQRIFSVFIEDYLLMCQPVPGVRTLQFGYGGAPIYNLRERVPTNLATFHPNVITMMYGMNDGRYSPFDEAMGKGFHDGNIQTIDLVKSIGVRAILVGSPSCVDWIGTPQRIESRKMYNSTLASLGDISRDVAKAEGVLFADIHGSMAAAIAKGEAADPAYYAGGDGTHVGPAGHLMIAYGFLKAMGFDGAVGTITVDLGASKAEGTPGQKILSVKDGTVEIESTRYPFCFKGDPAKPDTTTTLDAIKYLPFNEDLNRYMLVVHGLKSARARVTWGEQTQEFAAADLEKGVNLAATFIPTNPFSEQFAKVDAAAFVQQTQEVALTKDYMSTIDRYKKALPSEAAAFDKIQKAGYDQHQALSDATAALVVPVRHTLKIEPVP